MTSENDDWMQFKNLCWCFSQALSFKLYRTKMSQIRLKDSRVLVFFRKNCLKFIIKVDSEWIELNSV